MPKKKASARNKKSKDVDSTPKADDAEIEVDTAQMNVTNVTSTPAAAGAASIANITSDDLVELVRRQQISAASAANKPTGKPASLAPDKEPKTHAFWDTQPMRPKDDEVPTPPTPSKATEGESSTDAHNAKQFSILNDDDMNPETLTGGSKPSNIHGPVQPDKTTAEIRATPYNMPKGFEWCELNVHDAAQIDELYQLLSKNYVEDDDAMFRFDYSVEFLLWALTPPGYKPGFHLGVRSSKSGKLMGFISGVPADVRVYEHVQHAVEINFLCVHKRLRSKRLAPVLIKEMTRRVNLTGVFQAVYTAGVVLPVPVGQCRYYHRSLDPKKLIEVGFSRLQPRMTMARTQKLFKLPAETSTPNLRPMTQEDVPGAHKLLMGYLKKFHLAPFMTQEDFSHWLLPREGVVNSYVSSSDDEIDEATGLAKITNLCSFYHLPSTVIGNAKHTSLNAAYCFYHVPGTVSLTDLMHDCLILAKRENQDVFNALNLMENDEFLVDLKFGLGDGKLQYYIYNWKCPTMESKDIGLVLL